MTRSEQVVSMHTATFFCTLALQPVLIVTHRFWSDLIRLPKFETAMKLHLIYHWDLSDVGRSTVKKEAREKVPTSLMLYRLANTMAASALQI